MKFLIVVFLPLLWCSSTLQEDVLAKQQIQSYTRCSTDKDCKENAFCFGNDDTHTGKCKCIDGYELFRNSSFYECVKGSKVNESCYTDFQCQVGGGGASARCNANNICECEEGTHEYTDDGRCYITSLLGEQCHTSKNCLLRNGNYAACVYGQCSCFLQQRPTADKRDCVVHKGLGETCSRSDDCSEHNDVECADGICRCQMRFVPDRQEERCIPVAENLGDACEENAQCTKILSHSTCINSNCTCKDSYHEYIGKCFKTLRAGQSCTSKPECIFTEPLENNVDCQGGVCTCVHGQSDNEYGCKLQADPGSDARLYSQTLAFIIATYCVLLLL